MGGALASLLLFVAGLNTQTPIATIGSSPPSTGMSSVLSALPADTLLVASVRDLADCDGKLGELLKHLGLPVSPYALLKGSLEIVTGLDDAGSAAVAVMSPAASAEASQRMVLLLPTGDRAAMLAFLNPQPLDNGYAKVTLRGRESWVRSKGRFSVFGPDLLAVRHVVDAKTRLADRVSPYQLERFDADDLSFWVNTSALPGTKIATALEAIFRRMFGAGVESLSRYDSVQGSVRIEADGLSCELCAVRARPVSITESDVTGRPLLTGLPDERFALALGIRGGDKGTRIGSLATVVISVLTTSGVLDPSRSVELRQAYESLSSKLTGVVASASILPEGSDGRIAVAKVLHARDDGRALLDGIEHIVGLIKSGPFVDPRLNRVAAAVEYRRAAETTGNVVVDHLSVNLGGLEGVNHEALENVFGREGLLVRVGAVDGRAVIVTLGGGLPRFNEIGAALRSGMAPLALREEISKSAERVTGGGDLEAYVCVDRCVRLVRQVLGAVDVPTDFPEMPELCEPVVVTVPHVNPRETRIRIFIPTEVVVAAKDAMMARAAKRAGGGG